MPTWTETLRALEAELGITTSPEAMEHARRMDGHGSFPDEATIAKLRDGLRAIKARPRG